MNFYPQVYTDENPMRIEAICKANEQKKARFNRAWQKRFALRFARTAHFELGIGNLGLDEFNIG